jgi:hypothetical protein
VECRNSDTIHVHEIPKEDLMISSMTPGSARERILSDHDHLRRLMKRVAASAFESLCEEKRRAGIRDALAQLRAELEGHLEYEEITLGPPLASADPWGPVRAEHFLREHAGQRALLVALTEDASDGVRTIEALVEEIVWFLRSLERDMVDEEATFLNAEALGEEFFATDVPVLTVREPGPGPRRREHDRAFVELPS